VLSEHIEELLPIGARRPCLAPCVMHLMWKEESPFTHQVSAVPAATAAVTYVWAMLLVSMVRHAHCAPPSTEKVLQSQEWPCRPMSSAMQLWHYACRRHTHTHSKLPRHCCLRRLAGMLIKGVCSLLPTTCCSLVAE